MPAVAEPCSNVEVIGGPKSSDGTIEPNLGRPHALPQFLRAASDRTQEIRDRLAAVGARPLGSNANEDKFRPKELASRCGVACSHRLEESLDGHHDATFRVAVDCRTCGG